MRDPCADAVSLGLFTQASQPVWSITELEGLAIAVGPGLGGRALALLDTVAVGVVTVSPGAVAGKQVVDADGVTSRVAVAVGIVAEGGRAARGQQLPGLVVTVGRVDPVDGFR